MIHLEDARRVIAAYFIAKLDGYDRLTAQEHRTPRAPQHRIRAIGQLDDRAHAAIRGHRILAMLLRARSAMSTRRKVIKLTHSDDADPPPTHLN